MKLIAAAILTTKHNIYSAPAHLLACELLPENDNEILDTGYLSESKEFISRDEVDGLLNSEKLPINL